jgi:hypothetical protein
MQAQITASRYDFTPTKEEGGTIYFASNPAQSLSLKFGPSGLMIWKHIGESLGVSFNLAAIGENPASGDAYSVDKGLVINKGNDHQINLQNLEEGIRYSLTLSSIEEGATLDLRFPLTVGMRFWSYGLKLPPSDAKYDARFGNAVAVSDDVIVIGAPNDESAYVFQRMENGPDSWGDVFDLVGSGPSYHSNLIRTQVNGLVFPLQSGGM